MPVRQNISIWKSVCSLETDCRHFPHHDFGADSAILSRFFPRETAHHCAFLALATERAESAFYQCWHEPVRADLFGTTESSMETCARGRYAEVHSRGRQT